MNIVHALNRYSQGSHSRQDEEFIIEFCHRVAAAHLRFLDRNSGGRGAGYRSPQSISDEALTCISRLFCQPRKGGLPALADTWISLVNKQSENEDKAYNHLINLVRTVVWQQRVEVLRRSRPQEWKIRRSLRVCVTRAPEYRLIRFCGEALLTFKNRRHGQRNIVPEDLLKKYCLATFKGKDDMPTMLDKAMLLLKKYSRQYNSLRFGELADLITGFLAQILAAHSLDSCNERDLSERELISSLKKVVLQKIRDKIQTTYLDYGKLSSEMAELYLNALEILLLDLLATGETSSQYDYLLHVMPEMGKQEYLTVHKGKFGYLVAELRNQLKQTAEEFLKPSDDNRSS